MFIKIIKKDLTKKKSMNLILFLFIIITSTLIASSSNMIYNVVNALDGYFEKSNAGDLLVISYANEENTAKLKKWGSNKDIVKSYSYVENFYLYVDEFLLSGTEGIKELKSSFLLTTSPIESNLIFDEKNNKVFLQKGEAAIPVEMQEQLGLNVGDQFSIEIGEVNQSFIVKSIIKDAIFGSSMMGMKRMVVSQEEYEAYQDISSGRIINVWSFTKQPGITEQDIVNAYAKTDISTVASFGVSTIKSTYIIDMMIAGIMIVVSIFLIVFSLLILRFTIVFTLQNEYRQIGIMKAIGLRNKPIKRIYILKYLFLFFMGGIIGFLLSIPTGNVLLKTLSQNIVMEENPRTILINFISVIVIVAFMLLFCNACTKRLDKFSAIDAIRSGKKGERYTKLSKINLSKRKRMNLSTFLAINDLSNGFKRYITLVVTFIFSTLLVLIPINICNTLQSDDMIHLFGLPDPDVIIEMNDTLEFINLGEGEAIKNRLTELEDAYEVGGVPVSMFAEIMIATKMYINDENLATTVYLTKGIGANIEDYAYLEGTAPQHANEIAIAAKLADKLNVSIGDTIHCYVGEKNERFLVSAIYQTMNNLGHAIKLSSEYSVGELECNSMLIGATFKNSNSYSANLELMKKITPDYTFKSPKQFVSSMLGGVVDDMSSTKVYVLSIVMIINVLVTILVVRLLFSREIGEVAILKSLGFRDCIIKIWQIKRIGIVLLLSIIVGTLISGPITSFAGASIFYFAGATSVSSTINATEVYMLYPFIIFSFTIIAVMFSVKQVKKVKVWEVNNQE